MIVVVTPNPALDITYTLAHVSLGEVHRVHEVVQTAGGKGLNVARVLRTLGEEVTLGGFLGEQGGPEIIDLLGDGFAHGWLAQPGRVRRTVTLVHDGLATAFNEAGDALRADAWPDLTDAVVAGLGAGDVLAVAGSHPPGSTPQDLAVLVRRARAAGARVVVDTSGPALLAAAEAGADLLKPNAEELATVTGTQDPHTGARILLEAGAGGVIASLGEAGMLAVTTGDNAAPLAWHAAPVEALEGNPTGAGDAAVAALVRELAHHPQRPLHEALPTVLPEAVALSGAAVLRPTAGEVDVGAYERMRDRIIVKETHARR